MFRVRVSVILYSYLLFVFENLSTHLCSLKRLSAAVYIPNVVIILLIEQLDIVDPEFGLSMVRLYRS